MALISIARLPKPVSIISEPLNNYSSEQQISTVNDSNGPDLNELLNFFIEKNQQLTETNNQLKQVYEELDQFAYMASHDLQEPLRKIQIFSDKILSLGLPDEESRGGIILSIYFSDNGIGFKENQRKKYSRSSSGCIITSSSKERG